MKIAVLVGSLRADSWNKKFAQAVERAAPEGTLFVYGSLQLPLYNRDLESVLPAEVVALKELIRDADGVLIVTPEYNRSIPGVLKNAIDWTSRPHGDNSFQGKPVAVAGVSTGSIGTAVAQSHLRPILLYLDAKVMGQPEAYIQAARLFDEAGVLTEASETFVRELSQSIVTFFQDPQ